MTPIILVSLSEFLLNGLYWLPFLSPPPECVCPELTAVGEAVQLDQEGFRGSCLLAGPLEKRPTAYESEGHWVHAVSTVVF